MERNESVSQRYAVEFKGFDKESLPPTKISELAQERLEAWGASPESIEALRNFTSEFRYDQCLKKVERLTQKPAEVYYRRGISYGNLPSFRAINGRLYGQCADLAEQWIIRINDLGLINKLNKNRNKNRIVTAKYSGLSETHFCNEGDTHFWNGLVLTNEDGEASEEIYVDPAFQTIHTKDETRYKQKKALYNLGSIKTAENVKVPIGRIKVDNGWQVNLSGAVVLGVSSDFKYAYSLSFVRSVRTGAFRPRPVIERISENGSADFYFILEFIKDVQAGVSRPVIARSSENGNNGYYIIGNEGKFLESENAEISPQHAKEIEAMLRKASKLIFVEKRPTKNIVIWERKDKGVTGN